MSTIKKCLKRYGLHGIALYFQIKSGGGATLKVPGISNDVCLRKNTDDAKLFKQLLIHREYHFHSPIRPEFIIDAGANIGLSALYFATAFADAQIVAVEPESENFSLLQKNTANYKNITCLKAGLWHKSTTLELMPSKSGTTGFMVNETDAGNPEGFAAISPHEIIQKHNREYVDLFKIDIEGAEKELLSHNTEWLDKTRIVIIELHDRKKPGCTKAFFHAFGNRNFECHPFGQNFLLFNRDLIK